MRYIDADKLQLYLNDYALQVSPSESYDEKTRKWNEIVYMTIDTCMKAVDEQPTADVRENVRGEWIEKYYASNETGETVFHGMIICSVCGHVLKVGWLSDFCPHCGADMRGEA